MYKQDFLIVLVTLLCDFQDVKSIRLEEPPILILEKVPVQYRPRKILPKINIRIFSLDVNHFFRHMFLSVFLGPIFGIPRIQLQ